MRERWQRMTPEERRVEVARRDRERVREADRERGRTPGKRKRNAEYAQRNKEKVLEHKRSWVQRNPEKRKAHVAVSNALRDGKLTKGLCEVTDCATGMPVNAHHDDYSKPLEVRWLCTTHHGLTRRKD